jgi:hypothetical protein
MALFTAMLVVRAQLSEGSPAGGQTVQTLLHRAVLVATP